MLIRRSLIALLIIALSYAALLPFTTLPGFNRGSQGELNVMAAERYVYDCPDVPVVVVGSSISYWLHDLPEDWFNLALAGEGSLTGLAIIERSDAQPQTVLVEINVAERPVNEGLVDGLLSPGLRQAKQFTPMLRESNEPSHVTYRCLFLARYYADRVAEKLGLAGDAIDDGGQSSETTAKSDDSVPRSGGKVLREVRLEAVQKGYDQPMLMGRLHELRQMVEALDARGVRVVLFEAPEDAATYDSPRRSQLRRLVNQVLPADRFAYISRPVGETFQTRDGTHMTAESAKRYSHWLTSYLRPSIRWCQCRWTNPARGRPVTSHRAKCRVKAPVRQKLNYTTANGPTH